MNLPWYRRIFAANRKAELPRVEIDTAPGEIHAQFNLAMMYELGQGVPLDCAEATKWFLKAAQQGDAGGQLQMGKRCHRGSFAPLAQDARESRIEAYKWFTLASAQGYKNSEMHCEQIVLAMTREERTEGQ